MRKKNPWSLSAILPLFFAPALAAQIPAPIYGVTIDDTTDLASTLAALSGYSVKTTARIVFDTETPAQAYTEAVTKIHKVSYLMGEIVDSEFLKAQSLQHYKDRTKEYLDAFEDEIDIWEVGNEVNGDWTGRPDSVYAKVEAAYTMVKARGKKAAVNFYYNKPCLYGKPQYEMFRWIEDNVSAEMKSGLDYAFFSYYEDACEDTILTTPRWQSVFDSLSALFPNAKVGFGEVGTPNPNAPFKQKAETMRRYYSMDIKTPNYVLGGFWWNWWRNCVPKEKPLWDTLNVLFNARTVGLLRDKAPQKPTTPIQISVGFGGAFSFQIGFENAKAGSIKLTLTDSRGKPMADLWDGFTSAGEHCITWTPRNCPPGVYLLRLSSPAGIEARKIILTTQ